MAAQSPFPCSLRFAVILPLWMWCSALYAQDSLWVRSEVDPGPDTLAAECHWLATGMDKRGDRDTLWTQVARHSSLSVWGTSARGRAQLETPWPQHGDSLTVALWADSAGLHCVLALDTLKGPWSPRTAGCFPAAPLKEWNRFHEALLEQPFESQREAMSKAWLDQHCLTLQMAAELAEGFDDERRRLDLLKLASVTQPSLRGKWKDTFSSNRYREAFDAWWMQAQSIRQD